MINFRELTIEDKEWIDKKIIEEGSRSSDYNFTNMFMYKGIYKTLVADVSGCLGVKVYVGDVIVYDYPIGAGDRKEAISALTDDAKAQSKPFIMRGVSEEGLKFLEDNFQGKFTVTEDRNEMDYVYSAEKLATLSGKKMHSKKNHVNRFMKDHPDWSAEPVTAENISKCRDFCRTWMDKYETDEDPGLESEKIAMRIALENFEALKLSGCILKDGDDVLAFSIGDKMGRDCFDVHFEKALKDVSGCYSMINYLFAGQIIRENSDVFYINREEDMGHDGLRAAKESYLPDIRVRKFSAIYQD